MWRQVCGLSSLSVSWVNVSFSQTKATDAHGEQETVTVSSRTPWKAPGWNTPPWIRVECRAHLSVCANNTPHPRRSRLCKISTESTTRVTLEIMKWKKTTPRRQTRAAWRGSNPWHWLSIQAVYCPKPSLRLAVAMQTDAAAKKHTHINCGNDTLWPHPVLQDHNVSLWLADQVRNSCFSIFLFFCVLLIDFLFIFAVYFIIYKCWWWCYWNRPSF